MKASAKGKQKTTELIMRVLSRLVEGAGPDKNRIDKFVQDQLDQLLKSTKLHELVERVSFEESIPTEKALKIILEKMATKSEEVSKKSSEAIKNKSAASLNLLR